LGEKGKPAEKVGREAANSILASIRTGMAVDPHTTDHIILPASLAQGKTEISTAKITLHTLTAIELAKKFTKSKFSVTGTKGSPGRIICLRG
jgi:RNA 3'-terminal phosphate cyclase (ATP)